MLYHDLLDCDRKLTVCGTNVLLVERIIPLGIMARYQVTLDIEEPHRSFIAQVIHSFDLVAPSGSGDPSHRR